MFEIQTAGERALLAILQEQIANDFDWFADVLERPVSAVALARFVQSGLLKKLGPSDYEIQIDAVRNAACGESESDAGEVRRGAIRSHDQLSDISEACRGFNAGTLDEGRQAIVAGALAGRKNLRGPPYATHVRVMDNQ